MHKSKLAGFTIDCQTDDLDGAAIFWGGALGMPVGKSSGENNRYIELLDPEAGLHVEVQSVDHASRVHLDIETDDIEAEVRRLEALGAKRIRQIHTWWVMQAPSGHRFCVVRPQSPDFSERANEWP
jgi:predicted enzyme related to lactoylglutathione lyase